MSLMQIVLLVVGLVTSFAFVLWYSLSRSGMGIDWLDLATGLSLFVTSAGSYVAVVILEVAKRRRH